MKSPEPKERVTLIEDPEPKDESQKSEQLDDELGEDKSQISDEANPEEEYFPDQVDLASTVKSKDTSTKTARISELESQIESERTAREKLEKELEQFKRMTQELLQKVNANS